jgi:hypothetical protein
MSSDIKMDLFDFPKEVLTQFILYPLPAVDLYRFCQVSKACLSAVEGVAKLPQFEISLIARVTLLKEKEEKEEIGAFPFTNIDGVCKIIKQIGKKNCIVIDEGKIVISLEEKEGEVPLEKQTVTALLYRKLKTETLLRHRELLMALPKDTNPGSLENLRLPANRTLESLNYSFEFESPYFAACYPLMVLFDFHIKSYSEQKLGRALFTATTEIAHVPEVAFNIVNAIFRHPRAKDIPLGSLATALIKSIGETYEAKRSCYLGGGGGLNGKTTGKFYTLEHHVVPPNEMLKEGETKNLKIPRLIFSHPKSKHMNIKNQIDNMLLSAVRYRALDLVQKVLAHSDAEYITDDALVIARDEAKGAGELEIAKTVDTFLEPITADDKDRPCTLV